MHGRVKVKTPAAQAEARKAERVKKIQWYTTSVNAIFQKRDDQELDSELLAKTEELLRVNPDFMTMWNIRRQTLLHLLQEDKSKAAEAVPPTDESQSEDGEAIGPETTMSPTPTHDERLRPELSLTVACLGVNPKSYGAWHHRTWTMDQFDVPNWKKEVDLCSHALSMDSRNFHCWDYRRFVVQRSSRPVADEVAFTSEKIKASYSNYSAWHNRSRLLPTLFPGNAGCGVTHEKLAEELEFAKNAMYTDPVDQSAFFYHRWLLGREEAHLGIRCMYVDRQRQQLLVVLNRPVDLIAGSACIVVDDEYELASWQPASRQCPASTVLVCQLAAGQLSAASCHQLTAQVTFEDQIAVQMVCLEEGMAVACYYTIPSTYNMFRSLAAAPDVLQAELDSIVELLEINDEADSKWALLAALLLLHTLDPTGKLPRLQEYFDSLVNIDAMRRGYYNDLRSRYCIQSIAQSVWRNQDPEQLWLGGRSLDLSGKSLTGLFHLDCWPWLLRLDVSGNQLNSLDGCQVLCYLQELVANDNQLQEIGTDVAGMESLAHLSLMNNRIRSAGTCLRHLPNLKHLALSGNPVAEEDCTAAIFSMVTTLESLVLT